MMPVIRLSDSTFDDLTVISKWTHTETPSAMIERLVLEKMKILNMERDIGQGDDTPQLSPRSVEFGDKIPRITHTRVLSASIRGDPIRRPNWLNLLKTMINVLKKDNGLSVSQLVSELQIPAVPSDFANRGYTYYPELGISFQGQSARDSWKEVDRIAKKWRIPVEVQFQWRENKNAQYPGRFDVLRSGNEKDGV